MQQKNDKPLSITLDPLYRPCHAELRPGQARRAPKFGPLIGVFLRCPACNALGAHLAEGAAVVEEPDPPVRPEQPSGMRLAGLERARCYSCHRRIAIVGDELTATDER